MLKSFKANNPPLLMGKNTSEFDHSRWLFETKGTYGYGNALWPKDGAYNAGAGGGNSAPDFEKGRRRPLSRKKGISAGIISPYRCVNVLSKIPPPISLSAEKFDLALSDSIAILRFLFCSDY